MVTYRCLHCEYKAASRRLIREHARTAHHKKGTDWMRNTLGRHDGDSDITGSYERK